MKLVSPCHSFMKLVSPYHSCMKLASPCLTYMEQSRVKKSCGPFKIGKFWMTAVKIPPSKTGSETPKTEEKNQKARNRSGVRMQTCFVPLVTGNASDVSPQQRNT